MPIHSVEITNLSNDHSATGITLKYSDQIELDLLGKFKEGDCIIVEQ